MNGEIITVGTEILMGSILNTNSKYISEKLMELGIKAKYHTAVNDDFHDLESAIKIAMERTDVVVLSGGLGPTEDDITKEVLASVLNRKIVKSLREEEKLIEYFAKRKVEMTPNNLKQIEVIEGAEILENINGTAPGEFIETQNKKIFLMPGPPRELKAMAEKYFSKYLIRENNIQVKSLNIVDIGESIIEDRLRKMEINVPDLNINTFASFGEVEIKIIATGVDLEESKKKVKVVQSKMIEEFKQNIYSDNYISMSEALIERFGNLGIKISFAESVTGGLLASTITSYANASKILRDSYVVYSNESKKTNLQVSEKTLEKYGAVSRECALEMARGLKNKGLCNIAISTTGEAGPLASEDNPVGKIYVCYYVDDENYEIKEYCFIGSRRDIQKRAVKKILAHLLLNFKIKGNSDDHK